MAAQVEVVRGYVTADISNDYRINQIAMSLQAILDELRALNAKFDECAMVVRKGNG